jgi:DNA-binding transcriptional regulator GbsR (MarR family)
MGMVDTAPTPAADGLHHDAAATPDREVEAAQDRFIALWGEMGSSWGVPRSMAEIHALLFIVGEALHTDAIMQRLQVSRGNASMTLRTLVEWGIITRSHQRGDRRDYYRAEQDVWRLFSTILRARKRRELDPLMESLRACRVHGEAVPPEAVEHDARVDRMLDLVELIDRVSERTLGPNGPSSGELVALLQALAEGGE